MDAGLRWARLSAELSRGGFALLFGIGRTRWIILPVSSRCDAETESAECARQRESFLCHRGSLSFPLIDYWEPSAKRRPTPENKENSALRWRNRRGGGSLFRTT